MSKETKLKHRPRSLGKSKAETGVQEHGEVMRSIGHSNSSEEFGSQEHSVIMDAILGRS